MFDWKTALSVLIVFFAIVLLIVSIWLFLTKYYIPAAVICVLTGLTFAVFFGLNP